MRRECSLCMDDAAWTMVRVETLGAVDSFDCRTIDPQWSFACDDHLREALEIGRTLHKDQPYGVNIHVEELR